jgi:uncharacterized protein (TIGR02246 family)
LKRHREEDPVSNAFDGLVERWISAVQAKDAPWLAAMVTDDCVFLAPNAPPMRGRQAVEQLYAGLFAKYDVVQKFHFEETQMLGDWAFGWGTDDITMTPADARQTAHFVGHGMSILRRDADGTWRFARGINNAMRQKS